MFVIAGNLVVDLTKVPAVGIILDNSHGRIFALQLGFPSSHFTGVSVTEDYTFVIAYDRIDVEWEDILFDLEDYFNEAGVKVQYAIIEWLKENAEKDGVITAQKMVAEILERLGCGACIEAAEKLHKEDRKIMSQLR